MCMFDESSRPSSQSSLDYQTAWDTTHPPSVSDRNERAESMTSTLRSFSEHGEHEEAPRSDEVVFEELQIPRVVAGSRRSTRTPNSVDVNMNHAVDERMDDYLELGRRMGIVEEDHVEVGSRIPRVSTRISRFSESSTKQFEVTRVLESTLMDELRHHDLSHSPMEGSSTDNHDSMEGRDFFIEFPETPMTNVHATTLQNFDHQEPVETRNFAIEVPVTPAAPRHAFGHDDSVETRDYLVEYPETPMNNEASSSQEHHGSMETRTYFTPVTPVVSSHTMNHHDSVEARDYLIEYPISPMNDPDTSNQPMKHDESVETRDFHIEVPITPIHTDQASSGRTLEHHESVDTRDYLVEFPMTPMINDPAPSSNVSQKLKHHASMDTREYFVDVPETPAFHDHEPSGHTLKFQESVEARNFLIDIPKTPVYDAHASSSHPVERPPHVIEPEETREVRIEIPKTPNTPKTPSSPYFSDYRDQRELERQVKEREESLKGVVIEMVEERTEDMTF